MNALLVILSFLVCSGIIFLVPAKAPAALLSAALLATIGVIIINRIESDRRFLLRLFLAAILVRLMVGTVIFFFSLQDFFGGDADTYDQKGWFMQQGWHGNKYYATLADTFVREGVGAPGMVYVIAGLYEVIGRNQLAIQFINVVLGGATAVIIFLCALHLFGNDRVARLAGVLTAFFPSLVLWSSQGLKDGPIVFFLALTILATLKLGERLSLKYFLILIACLISLLSLRFYIFYMMVSAIIGAFVIGMRSTAPQSFIRQAIVIIGIGLAMTWFGVIRTADRQLSTFGNLQAVARSRMDAAQMGKSGFAADVDVSTTQGALTAIPIGLLYLFFAPFPWQVVSLRQTITLPEMIIWWAAFPMLIAGLWFALKHKFREISPILIFTVMLSLAYSVFQGNVGTAYRQRAQLLVFYFIFVAVGVILLKEKQEEKAQRIREAALAQRNKHARCRASPRQVSSSDHE